MNEIDKQDGIRRGCHAQWISAGKPASGPIKDALDAANRLYAEMKSLRQPAPPSEPPVDIADIRAIMQERQKALAFDKQLARARRMWNEANEFPRMGDRWGMYSDEKKAERLLKVHFGPDWQELA